mmetsp:Transcript_15795/g.19258  ORF Transcript_15795/g.19258 Transcript_15795/m.19258 type:complete len:888 (-) Transcript_15795:66-2729(-)
MKSTSQRNREILILVFFSFLSCPLISTNASFIQPKCFQKHVHTIEGSYLDSNRSFQSLTKLYVKDERRKLQTKKRNRTTVNDIVEEFKRESSNLSQTKKKKSRRSRKKTSNPKQTYLYAKQRKEMERLGIKVKNNDNAITNNEENDTPQITSQTTPQIRLNLDKNSPITIARNFGMNPALQSCDASFALVSTPLDHINKERLKVIIPLEKPKIIGEVRIGTDDNTMGETGMTAYVIEKPAGWAILEGSKKKEKKQGTNIDGFSAGKVPPGQSKDQLSEKTKLNLNDNTVSQKKTKSVKYYDEGTDEFDVMEFDFNENDLFSLMTPEELKELKEDGGIESLNLSDAGAITERNAATSDNEVVDKTESINEDTEETGLTNNLSAVFASEHRLSIVTWLKDLKAAEGTPIRGGNNWKAIAGAVNIDDSGLVVLCPKDNTENIFVDNAAYFTVVGNDKYLAPKGKKNNQPTNNQFAPEDVKVEVYAKLKKGRGDDLVVTAKLTIPDGVSTCDDTVQICQKHFLDGIRGDAAGNPLERRANRRLVHCSSITLSSLTHDDVVECDSKVPDDIRALSERRNHHEFRKGSFLGRQALSQNDHTTAYREINGASDGWPGWIVDRYDKWLFVQHDDFYPKGPLPSLHDGATTGVYYFASDPDRSITGSVKGTKPTLLEGQPAPDSIEILENGVKYHVNFDELSTGIFLDQRSQRAWLMKHCTHETRILNCFAHCGAFSIAAATAGSETVSLDLEKKWLDRIEPQMKANGIDDLSRHDSIYGDCFDWLARLAKRGEQFDLLILDPPSTSVGGKKKKRWSAKNDYDQLVSLAAPLVKKGGLLWTTTNSKQINAIKFARMCKKGFDNAGLSNVKLERVATMPMDFPSIGPQAVKNLVWRL